MRSRLETVLRCHGMESAGSADDAGARLLRIEPRDGAVCVFRDTPVIAHFSRPLDADSVGPDSFRVWDDRGAVAGLVRLSPDASVLIWEPGVPLVANVHHFVIASGLRDVRGHELASHLSRFLTCDLTRKDLTG